jgi:hypothetical protein
MPAPYSQDLRIRVVLVHGGGVGHVGGTGAVV